MLRLAVLSFATIALAVMMIPATGGAQQIKAGGASKIPPGGCCAKVHNACISHCTKSGGCTGKGDCVVLKSK